MKKLLLFIGIIFSLSSSAQIYGPTAASSGPTNYQTVSFTDSVFYYCTPITNAELLALPPSGSPNWNFIWQKFDVPTNSWVAYSTTTNAASSTITGLTTGGYRVTIIDGTSTIVGCYRAWIVEVLSPTIVTVDPIPPGCGAVQLNGNIDWGSATPYYEPPSEPMLIDANTTITVCFEATHTYVSDLGFYLVSPAFCGNSTVTLCPNPGSIGQGATCNSGDNVGTSGQDLCFTTSAAPNLDVCNPAPSSLQGTYDSYGAANIPINWSPIYGCDASQPGWAVQIYDCIGADVGVLQYASITFTGTTMCGDPATITYDSGPISSVINDNSCSPGTASIYVVPASTAQVVAYDTNFIWTASPNITIPGATTDYSPLVNPGPNQTTTFTLSVDTTGGAGAIGDCCGGNWQDSEVYIYTPPTAAVISGPTTACSGDAPFNLFADVPGGTWGGPGIIDPATGLFDPGDPSTNMGANTVFYSVSNPCPINSFYTVTVTAGSSTAIVDNPGNQCVNGTPITLTANPSGGIFNGPGITDTVAGTFDPVVAGVGTFVIDYYTTGTCPSTGSVSITVDTLPDASFTLQSDICVNGSAFNIVPTIPGGTFSGTGITNGAAGTFDPSVSGAGNFCITYTLTSPCTNSSTSCITVNALPNVNASADQSICPGDTAQISASGANTYVWNNASTLSSSTSANTNAFPAGTTTYIVTGTDGNGCTDTAAVTITIFNPATVTFSGGSQICEGDSLQITANNLTNVSWTPTATVSSPNNATTYVTPDITTIYTVAGDDPNGCAVTGTVTITVNTVDADMSANPTSGVIPMNVDFSNNSSNGVMYIWDFGDGNVDTTFTMADFAHVYTTDGTYTVTLTTISAAGCVDQTTLTIVAIPDCYLGVPNVFSPNGDNVNDRVDIECSRILATANMKIFDRWGKLVAELTNPNATWDGDGQSEGVFYYVLIGEGFNGTAYNLNGYITLMR